MKKMKYTYNVIIYDFKEVLSMGFLSIILFIICLVFFPNVFGGIILVGIILFNFFHREIPIFALVLVITIAVMIFSWMISSDKK